MVNSITPGNPIDGWGIFSLNTLQRLRERVDDPPTNLKHYDFISSFAAIYHHLFSLSSGEPGALEARRYLLDRLDCDIVFSHEFLSPSATKAAYEQVYRA